LFKNVLVAVDGSENSKRALDLALDLGEKYDANVMILNVSGSLAMSAIPEESPTPASGSVATFARDLRKIHEEVLSEAVAHAKMTKPDLTISSMLREGDPALEIVDVAKEGGFDLVVIGHKGVGRVKEFLLC
jgi:nucleotide-binding universal stress UspA family protein